MNDLSVIDQFTTVFAQYIDAGFGLLSGEVAFLTATLVAIDITLAGLFWAMSASSGEDVIAKLAKKTLYVGAFAFIITNFNDLAQIIFKSFAGLGITAADSLLTEQDLFRPGRLAAVGVDAARPILEQVGELTGITDTLLNLDSIIVLFLAWLIVIISFFILAVQLFVTLIEFKLTTLAGFVLIPFALWNKTAFLAERVLGNVVSSGIKILVLAVIIGVGSNIFGEFVATPDDDGLTIDNALAIMLGSLALLGLGLFGPGVATGLVSGAPQLGAGAAAGTALATGGLAVAGGAAAAATGAGAIKGTAAAISGARAAAPIAARAAVGTARAAGAAGRAYRTGSLASGNIGAASVAPGLANVARAAAPHIKSAASNLTRGVAGAFKGAASASPKQASTGAPAWATRLQRRAHIAHGASTAAHVVRSTDHPGAGANPTLPKD